LFPHPQRGSNSKEDGQEGRDEQPPLEEVRRGDGQEPSAKPAVVIVEGDVEKKEKLSASPTGVAILYEKMTEGYKLSRRNLKKEAASILKSLEESAEDIPTSEGRKDQPPQPSVVGTESAEDQNSEDRRRMAASRLKNVLLKSGSSTLFHRIVTHIPGSGVGSLSGSTGVTQKSEGETEENKEEEGEKEEKEKNEEEHKEKHKWVSASASTVSSDAPPNMRATHQERDDDSERNEISCGKLEGRETSLEQTERKEKVRDKMSEIEVLDRPHDQEERSTIPGEEEDNQAINRRGGCGNDLMVVDMAEREQSNTQQQESKAESRSRTNSPLMKRVSSELHLNAMIIRYMSTRPFNCSFSHLPLL